MRSGERAVMSPPSNMIRPDDGRSTPVRQLKKVLLPAPFGPMTARISPRCTAKLTLLRAVRPPKRIVRSSVRRIGAVQLPDSRKFAGRREDRLLSWDEVEDAKL